MKVIVSLLFGVAKPFYSILKSILPLVGKLVSILMLVVAWTAKEERE